MLDCVLQSHFKVTDVPNVHVSDVSDVSDVYVSPCSFTGRQTVPSVCLAVVNLVKQEDHAGQRVLGELEGVPAPQLSPLSHPGRGAGQQALGLSDVLIF